MYQSIYEIICGIMDGRIETVDLMEVIDSMRLDVEGDEDQMTEMDLLGIICENLEEASAIECLNRVLDGTWKERSKYYR